MLMGAGYGIGNHSFEALRELASGGVHTTIPTRLAAVAAAVSIITKEALYRASIVYDSITTICSANNEGKSTVEGPLICSTSPGHFVFFYLPVHKKKGVRI